MARGAALALNGFPLSAVEKPQPDPVYSDFMNELRRGVGQEIFARGTNEILGCARAMKKGRMLGLIADQDGGYNGIFVPFFGRWLRHRKVRRILPASSRSYHSHLHHPQEKWLRPPRVCEGSHLLRRYGRPQKDDYNVTLKMTQEVEAIIREYPDNWIWFQHRWNTPYEG